MDRRRTRSQTTAPKPKVFIDSRSKSGVYLFRLCLGGKRTTLSTCKTEKRAAEKERDEIIQREIDAWRNGTPIPNAPSPSHAPSPLPGGSVRGVPSKIGASVQTIGIGVNPKFHAVERGVSPKVKGLFFDDVVKEWFAEYCQENPRSATTVGGYLSSWKKHGLNADRLNDLNHDLIYAFQLKLIPAVSNRTADSILTYLKKLCRWCLEKGYLEKDPSVKIDPKLKANYGGFARNKDVWEEKFFLEFLEHFKVADRKALKVYWHTGIDLCDIARIEIKHIKTYADKQRYIELLRFKAKDKSAKSKEVIRFPVDTNPKLKWLIDDAINRAKEENRTFLFNRGEVDPGEFTRRLTNKRTEVFRIYYPGKTELTWKALRYTFFTRCRNSNIPDPVLVKWGGWVDASMLYRHYDQGVTTGDHMHSLNNPKVILFNERRKMA